MKVPEWPSSGTFINHFYLLLIMKKHISPFHYITHSSPRYSHIEQAQMACESGAKWIQYRCFTKTDQELIADLELISSICDDWGATLIVTDHLHLRDEADIQGFHIEDMSADLSSIRELLGDSYILGGSANNLTTLSRLQQEGADYAGFGPFKKSATKPNNYPFISLDNYRLAVQQIQEAPEGLPLIAVGGVDFEDLRPLSESGIKGVALSAALLNAPDFRQAFRDYYHAWI